MLTWKWRKQSILINKSRVDFRWENLKIFFHSIFMAILSVIKIWAKKLIQILFFAFITFIEIISKKFYDLFSTWWKKADQNDANVSSCLDILFHQSRWDENCSKLLSIFFHFSPFSIAFLRSLHIEMTSQHIQLVLLLTTR